MAWNERLASLLVLWHELVFYISFSFTLINTFGAGTKWIIRTVRLLAFVLILIVPILRRLRTYLYSDKILHHVSYGPNKRNSLDVYLISDKMVGRDLAPVVVYIGGGGWTVGFRVWALLMAKFFTDEGVLLISVDYRNFPQGTVSEMLTDVNTALSWTIANVSQYGGDPDRVHVMGQSAGSHLVLLAAIDQAARECFIYTREHGMTSSVSYCSLTHLDSPSAPSLPAAPVASTYLLPPTLSSVLPRDRSPTKPKTFHPNRSRLAPLRGTPPRNDASPMRHDNGFDEKEVREKKNALARSLTLSGSRPPEGWRLSNIRSLLLLSGPFDVSTLIPHLHERGLYRQVMFCIMEGEISHNSPYSRLQKRTFLESGAADRLPPIYLLHGDKDETIPYQESIRMREVLDEAHVDVKLKIYKGRNHTDAVFEDMFSGDNPMMEDVVTIIKSGWEEVEKNIDKQKEDWPRRKEVEKWRMVLARYVNPF